MAAVLDNANPTILGAEQLPTRHKKAAPREGPDTRYDGVLFQTASYLSSGGVSHDAFAPDPIDEQEIYGTHSPSLCSLRAPPLNESSLVSSPRS